MPRGLLALVAPVWLTVLLGPQVAWGDEPAEGRSFDRRLASALIERGLNLADAGECAAARALLAEAVERDPDGPRAPLARERIVACEIALGLRPAPPRPPAPTAPPDARTGATPAEPTPPSAAKTEEIRSEPTPPRRPTAPVDGVSGATPVGRLEAEPVRKWVPRAIDAETARRTATRVARTSLVLFSGAYGFTATVLILGAVESGAPTSAGLVGGVAGAFAAYLAVRNRAIAPGDAATWMSALTWGGLAGLALANVIDDPLACDHDPFLCTGGGEDVHERHYHLSALIGTGIGLGTGIALSVWHHPSTGDVALVNSMTAYGVGAGLLFSLALPPEQTRGRALTAIVGGGLGLAAGFVLAPRIETSRSRMLLVDLGAVAGAFTGYFLIGALAGTDDLTDDDEQLRATFALGGLAVGAALAWYVTRNRDRDRAPRVVASRLAPPALIARDGDGTWRIGELTPIPIVTATGDAAVGISIVSGRF